ncbi:hypothetical protein Hdeb2414_s1051g00976601 [Helianthus debilis subsp. tardiflorus]
MVTLSSYELVVATVVVEVMEAVVALAEAVVAEADLTMETAADAKVIVVHAMAEAEAVNRTNPRFMTAKPRTGHVGSCLLHFVRNLLH